MENLVLPAATMCINVQKPGVPDSVEQKRALCVVYYIRSTGVLQNNFIHLTARDLNRSHAWISEVVSTQCASASDEIWRIRKKIIIFCYWIVTFGALTENELWENSDRNENTTIIRWFAFVRRFLLLLLLLLHRHHHRHRRRRRSLRSLRRRRRHRHRCRRSLFFFSSFLQVIRDVRIRLYC